MTDDIVELPRQLAPGPFILLTGRTEPGWSVKGSQLEVAAKLGKKKKAKTEPPSPETSCASDPEEPDWWATSASPDYPGGGTGTSWDDATGPLGEENTFQALPDEPWASIICFFSLRGELCQHQPVFSLLLPQEALEDRQQPSLPVSLVG